MLYRSNNEGGPNTPACHRESKHIGSITNYGYSQDAVELLDVLRSHNGVDQLWRENRRPLHRTTRRRGKLEYLDNFMFTFELTVQLFVLSVHSYG